METYTNIWLDLPVEKWKDVIESSSTRAEVARKVGRSPGSGFNERLKNYCLEHNISTEHFTTKENNLGGKEKYTLDEILIENSPVTRRTLKDYLAKYDVLEYKCAVCGNKGEWNGVSLTLQIDHINGIRNDNRKENLRWLCPNCHSQTDTYTGKNKTKKEVINFTVEEAIEALKKTENVNQATKLIGCAQGGANWIRVNDIKKEYGIIQLGDLKKEEKQIFEKSHINAKLPSKRSSICKKCGRPLSTSGAEYCQTCIHEFQRKCEWPSREELKELIRNTPFLQIGKKYNVSDNTVRKWCLNYKLPSKKKDIKAISEEDWLNI